MITRILLSGRFRCSGKTKLSNRQRRTILKVGFLSQGLIGLVSFVIFRRISSIASSILFLLSNCFSPFIAYSFFRTGQHWRVPQGFVEKGTFRKDCALFFFPFSMNNKRLKKCEASISVSVLLLTRRFYRHSRVPHFDGQSPHARHHCNFLVSWIFGHDTLVHRFFPGIKSHPIPYPLR